ncbi:hypothetical protein MTR67_001880 [Solanum verrucosum]|uniref:Chromo domain-containing protein n=1 Tax=Solanum verrucosum TaxID=315347 RepID=A0AAF0PRC8_SOLVR|nr:hypothetical protein MTR67_001880 [Solanum verrucosum]
MLNKCMGDPSLIITTEYIVIKDNLSFEEIPAHILDRQVRKLRTKEVTSVKVLWGYQFLEEDTWESKEDMKNSYPHLFDPEEIRDQSKTNVVADVVSRLSMCSTAHVEEEKRELTEDVQRLARLGVQLMDSNEGGIVVMNGTKSSLVSKVKET